jgi:hypothetical protein
MNSLNNYGTIAREYNGKGTLKFQNGNQLKCNFRIAQFIDGRIYALCKINVFHIDIDEEIIELNGETENGMNLIFNKNLSITNVENEVNKDEHCLKITLRGDKITTNNFSKDNRIKYFKFAITNFTILGTETRIEELPNGKVNFSRQVELNLDGFDLVIRPIKNYNNIIKELRSSRYINITALIEVYVDSPTEKDKIEDIVDNLCWLLSLARGCKINWLYYDILTNEDETIGTFHKSGIIKKFGTLELIATNPGKDLKNFIKKTYPKLREIQKIWKIKKAIDGYTDAKAEDDFLEFRGLKLAVTMEYLKGIFLKKDDKQNIIDKNLFDNSSLEGKIRRLLSEQFPEVESSKLDIMGSHIRGINRYSFKKALSFLCNYIGLNIERSKLTYFTKIRNELVHTASFHPNTSEYGENIDQYFFMMTFVGKVLLAILEYDGYYYDYTKPFGYVSEDMEMRVKLDLMD